MEEPSPESEIQTDSSNESLEAPSFTQPDSAAPASTPELTPPPAPKKSWRRLTERFNVYLLLFILLLVLAVIVVLVSFLNSKKYSTSADLSSKSLSAKTLAQLANSDATVGSANQVLNVQSGAVFAGKVLVRQDLDVAGNLNLGGILNLNDLAVAGTAQFGDAQVNKNLAVAGNTSLQGGLTAKSLQVSGNGSFSGPVSAPQLTTSNLQLNGDLVLTHHLTAGGPTPSHSNGGALGNGGTASLSGSDTAGSISINTGSSPAAGCFITVNFSSKFNATPHVLVTPIGNAAGGIAYYVNRSTSGFSVCDNNGAPAGSSFGFDYFVLD